MLTFVYKITMNVNCLPTVNDSAIFQLMTIPDIASFGVQWESILIKLHFYNKWFVHRLLKVPNKLIIKLILCTGEGVNFLSKFPWMINYLAFSRRKFSL